MNFAKNPNSASTADLATRWAHDRRLISAWMQRETGGHFDHAEIRADGSSFIAFPSPVGEVTVHDYWSFARSDFQSADRARSYAEALSRQVPILTLGYARPGADRSELVVYLNGELTTTVGYAEAFAPFTAGQPAGALIAIESTRQPAGMTFLALYDDPFLISVLTAIWQQTLKPPGLS